MMTIEDLFISLRPWLADPMTIIDIRILDPETLELKERRICTRYDRDLLNHMQRKVYRFTYNVNNINITIEVLDK